MLVNGKVSSVDAFLKDDRVYVAIAQLPEVLAPYGVTSYAEYSPKTNILQWSVSASSRAREGTLGAGLEALWRGDVVRAKTQLEFVQGADQSTAHEILRSIAVLGDRPEEMGVVRFNWAITPQLVSVFLEETEVPAGTLMMVVPTGSRLLTFQDSEGPFQTARIKVRAGQATNVTISPSL